MEFWLNAVDINVIHRLTTTGLIYGLTTNPTLFCSQSVGPEVLIPQYLAAIKGPLAIQVVAETASDMIDQGTQLHSLDNEIMIKIPASHEGYSAMTALVQKNIPVMATAVYTVQQALVCASLGVNYIAPYLGRMEAHGQNAMKELAEMQDIIQKQRLSTKIIGAAIRHTHWVLDLAKIGIAAVTLDSAMFNQLFLTNSLTKTATDTFFDDWKMYLQSTCQEQEENNKKLELELELDFKLYLKEEEKLTLQQQQEQEYREAFAE